MTIIMFAPTRALANETDVLTVDEYEEYLKSESIEDYFKFEELSNSEKEEFVDLLSNPMTYVNNETSKNIENHEHNEEISISSTKSSVVSRNTWGTRTVSLFGIDILKYKIEAGYKVSKGKIKSINYYDAYVVKNLNPMCQTSTQSKHAYISNNRLYTKGVFYYKVGPLKGLSVQIGNIYGQLISYPNGSSSVSYWRD